MFVLPPQAETHPPVVIMVQAENEFSAGNGHSDYMQDIINLYRANDITVRKYCVIMHVLNEIAESTLAITHNDQHAGANGNFSPDLPGEGRVNIYWYV